MKPLFAFVLALCLQGAALAQADAAHYRLTAPTIQKLTLVQQDITRAGIDTSRDLSGNEPVEVMARKIEANGAVAALLEKHGLTAMDCALTINAMLHAASYLEAEQGGDKAKADSILAAATPEQRANIELLRRASR